MMKTTGLVLLVLGIILAVVGGTSRRAPAQAPRSDKEMTLDLGGGVTMELVLIQPGTFPMGSKQPNTEESPVHKVTISKPFYMGKYTVTQKQWEAVMGSNMSYFKGPDNPADGVSWDDCQTFLRKLGEKVGGGRTFALPTEAQWEYACRAGTTGKYCYGDDEARLGEYAWFNGNSGDKTHPVGQKKPNAWGLYDMHGNVMEWCLDRCGTGVPYDAAPQTDPVGPATGPWRILRGGSWTRTPADCRSAYRHGDPAYRRDYNIGCRVVCGPAAVPGASKLGGVQPATRLFNCDFNWARGPNGKVRPSMPEDWAEVDAQRYFDWHREFGNNVMYCQAYCSSGFALYPSKLGPLGKGKAAQLFPELYTLARKAKMPVWSYFCVSADLFQSREHPEWIVPGSRPDSWGHGGLFGPETPHTQLVCARLREFLKDYSVDWLLLDWFVYGSLTPDEALVQPAEFVKQPFEKIIGRPMPSKAKDITPEEHRKYKRVTLENQFRALKQAVKETSPNTKIIFNVPFRKANESLWRDHPMLTESDGLFAESSDEVVGWLLNVRKPGQRVMTTIVGREKGVTDPGSWKKWYDHGCDFFGYAWGTPPSFHPIPMYDGELAVVKGAFAEIEKLDAEKAKRTR